MDSDEGHADTIMGSRGGTRPDAVMGLKRKGGTKSGLEKAARVAPSSFYRPSAIGRP